MNFSKRVSFGMFAAIIIILATATILEKIYGSEFVHSNIYSTKAFVLVWSHAASIALAYMIRSRLYKRPVIFLLHISFMVILSGAAATWAFGEQGSIHLRRNIPEQMFANGNGEATKLPFSIKLNDFKVIYYTGTSAAMDYVSSVEVTSKKGDRKSAEISMNNIFKYDNYRFYQSGYDEDGDGTRLAVSHDPYGITITYCGYALLFVAMLLFFLDKKSMFRTLLRHPLLKESKVLVTFITFIAISLSSIGSANAAQHKPMPNVLPAKSATTFGDLYTLYNNRICPVQTVARDFTIKLYGSSIYRSMTSEQVFTGFILFMDSWKDEPIIKIKSSAVRSILGIEGKYASMMDFANSNGDYKLDMYLEKIHQGIEVEDKRGIEESDEKYNLVLSLFSGKMLKLFPYHQENESQMEWFAQADKLPSSIVYEEYMFIHNSMSLLGEMAAMKRYTQFDTMVSKIKKYQQKKGGSSMPSQASFQVEKFYNNMSYTKPLAMGFVTIGIISFILYVIAMTRERRISKRISIPLNVMLGIALLYITITISLRTYISGHIPLSNGYETMQFMAWCTLLFTLLFQRKINMIIPFGFLISGVTLMVSMFGETNPQITQLMPVLSSPLLSIHVVVIMLAYCLLAFMMLNGVTAVVLKLSNKENDRQIELLHIISRIMLYPALFLLTAGIFIGAIWANISWGRYWGWDPKEVWALITMMVYASAIHTASLPAFRRPMFFHIFTIIAFLTVLITYFGVNFILGGMHSYA